MAGKLEQNSYRSIGMIKIIKYLVHCILVPREYFLIDGKVYIREGFNRSKELYWHMRDDHGWSDAEINDLMLEARKLLNTK